MSQGTQRLTSLLLAVVLALPLSAYAENRSRGRTVLDQIAAELELRRRDTATAESPDSAEQAIVDAMNRERARHGLRPLRLERRLSLAAHDRAEDMFAKRYFNHVSPDGINPFTWVTRRGYRYSTIGENLALGLRSSDSIVDGWMRSPGHRQNILTRDFDEVGIAIGDGSPKRGYRGPLVVALYAAQ